MKKILQSLAAKIAPFKNLVFLSLAFWVMHVILRSLLLFRSNPYGLPFVSKPDWYIFHAVCFDFIWICYVLVIFGILGILIQGIFQKIFKTKRMVVPCIISILYGILNSVILIFTVLDHELLRFLGCHMSFGLLDTYKDTSSILMLWDYVENDYSIPFLQFFLLALVVPFTFGIYKFLKSRKISTRRTLVGMVIFFIASYCFVNFIWTGNARATKLKPVINIVVNELLNKSPNKNLSDSDIAALGKSYQALWQKTEGDSLWTFANDANMKMPLYRIPGPALVNNETLQARRLEQPNIIVIMLESHRGMNCGFLNPGESSPTPFLDSMAANSHVWERMHTSGLPTTGGVLSTHIGIPHHSTLSQATDLAHVTLPSYASVMTDSGYATHYFSAADPAWDNLGVWMSKWYTGVHYNRNREDDSTFIDNAILYVKDTLAKQGKPFLATLTTRSNHYPFNFAAGMTDEEKQLPLTERIKVTMHYADRQLARFIHSIEQESWYKNTYVIVMADHAFPLGENGISTLADGGFFNTTWIPFIIHGKGLDAKRDTATAAQIDIAPTILELAGIAVPNIFMGHNLLRGYGEGMSLGAFTKQAALGLDGYRIISRYPLQNVDVAGFYADGDLHQNHDIASEEPEKAKQLGSLLDTLIRLSDYSLEHGM